MQLEHLRNEICAMYDAATRSFCPGARKGRRRRSPFGRSFPSCEGILCEYLMQRYVKSRGRSGGKVFHECGLLFALSEAVTHSLCAHGAHKYI